MVVTSMCVNGKFTVFLSREAPPNPPRLKDVYRFIDPEEVEIVARCCRKYTEDDDEILDPEAIKLSELVIKVQWTRHKLP